MVSSPLVCHVYIPLLSAPNFSLSLELLTASIIPISESQSVLKCIATIPKVHDLQSMDLNL